MGPKQERDKLMQLLIADGARSTEAVDEINELVKVLEASELPFKESRIGGGPWVVRREREGVYNPGGSFWPCIPHAFSRIPARR